MTHVERLLDSAAPPRGASLIPAPTRRHRVHDTWAMVGPRLTTRHCACNGFGPYPGERRLARVRFAEDAPDTGPRRSLTVGALAETC